MTEIFFTRRTLFVAAGAMAATGVTAGFAGLITPARAQSLAPTPTMRGGANNYRPGAPVVERIGGGGFWMTGTVRRAGDGAPLAGRRIQIWAHTTEGNERDERSHGATLTDANGEFRLEMPQIVPTFGQPHGHLAYDAAHDAPHADGAFETVFLRPVMPSPGDTTLHADFVLQPV
ncbi:MAG: twin-arginine translocation pathway signal [Hoeflea sp.]|uniref:twin-arginine translocation pathway signal n=1 Tax=Hoeflea sp. TaxID=1940281 RepID=UPI001DB4FD46|nr:twin-arginine translocation pathway signal [Hoeflea sp.]MBU4529625.1 Twin-arginine translocation pathway signal [Alphaproteobacteria bacterium]MBU4546744.1 Twin-arginine translocation pathway signal [Alphaproteobacteria bacterium]MBU4551012.1 Twin-arginine translocation pathway signal [Alphaproteobacteria bacterium]MBV1723954.1 twin-arginine translocation pathway signal [Hoeflea sp.]MBV1763231.1 twin-arginine translocation pathway signal [Hoeflea sp.]